MALTFDLDLTASFQLIGTKQLILTSTFDLVLKTSPRMTLTYNLILTKVKVEPHAKITRSKCLNSARTADSDRQTLPNAPFPTVQVDNNYFSIAYWPFYSQIVIIMNWFVVNCTSSYVLIL